MTKEEIAEEETRTNGKEHERTYKGRWTLVSFDENKSDPRPHNILNIFFGKFQPNLEKMLQEHEGHYRLVIRLFDSDLPDLEGCVVEHNEKLNR